VVAARPNDRPSWEVAIVDATWRYRHLLTWVVSLALSLMITIDQTVTPAFAATAGSSVSISLAKISPLVALIAGVLILVLPRLLNYIVALYLIVIGLTGLFGH